MTHQQHNKKSRRGLDKVKAAENSGGATNPPPAKGADVPGNPTPSTELTDDEQMALYEQELKENDWGHQPC